MAISYYVNDLVSCDINCYYYGLDDAIDGMIEEVINSFFSVTIGNIGDGSSMKNDHFFT